MAHFSSALRLLLQRPLASVFGAVALALGLVLAGLSWWVLDVVGNAQSAIEDQIVVRARLDPKLDEAATQTTLLALLEVPGVGTAEWVGPEAQKTELTKLLGEDLLAGLDEAVFPRGGLVRLTIERGTVSDASDLEAMLTAVKKVDHVEGVADVPFDPRHLAFLFDAAAVARIVGLGLALLALLAGALAIYQRVSLALAARGQELALYRAFGASEGWLMGRYFVLALLIGAMASGLAILVGLVIDGPLSDLASLLPNNTDTRVTSIVYLGGVIAGALGIAAGAGFYAVAREKRG